MYTTNWNYITENILTQIKTCWLDPVVRWTWQDRIEDRSIEISQSEKQSENRLKKKKAKTHQKKKKKSNKPEPPCSVAQ